MGLPIESYRGESRLLVGERRGGSTEDVPYFHVRGYVFTNCAEGSIN